MCRGCLQPHKPLLLSPQTVETLWHSKDAGRSKHPPAQVTKSLPFDRGGAACQKSGCGHFFEKEEAACGRRICKVISRQRRERPAPAAKPPNTIAVRGVLPQVDRRWRTPQSPKGDSSPYEGEPSIWQPTKVGFREFG